MWHLLRFADPTDRRGTLQTTGRIVQARPSIASTRPLQAARSSFQRLAKRTVDERDVRSASESRPLEFWISAGATLQAPSPARQKKTGVGRLRSQRRKFFLHPSGNECRRRGEVSE